MSTASWSRGRSRCASMLARTARRLDHHAGRLRPRRLAGDTTAIAMQRGGQAADVWVVSPKPVDASRRCCPASARSFRATCRAACRAAPPTISSGSAAMSSAREGTVRILRAYHARLAETSDPDLPLLADIARLSRSRSASTPRRRSRPAWSRPSTAPSHSAGQIRDRFSPDGWLALRDLSKTAHKFADTRGAGRRRDPRDDRAPAQARRLLRPRAREHVPLRRLALPGDRPPARARHPDRPHARPAGRARTRPTARSTCCSRSATAS